MKKTIIISAILISVAVVIALGISATSTKVSQAVSGSDCYWEDRTIAYHEPMHMRMCYYSEYCLDQFQEVLYYSAWNGTTRCATIQNWRAAWAWPWGPWPNNFTLRKTYILCPGSPTVVVDGDLLDSTLSITLQQINPKPWKVLAHFGWPRTAAMYCNKYYYWMPLLRFPLPSGPQGDMVHPMVVPTNPPVPTEPIDPTPIITPFPYPPPYP
jgi:hypothetical protein